METWKPIDVRDCESFADLLKRAEKLNRVTNGRLHKATGIPIANLREYKTGIRMVGVDNARKIAAVLRLPEDDVLWLLDKDDKTYRSPR